MELQTLRLTDLFHRSKKKKYHWLLHISSTTLSLNRNKTQFDHDCCFFFFVFIEHKYSDRMQSQNSQLVLSIYTSENGNKGGLDVSLGKKFITREKAPEVGNAG